MRSAPKVPKPRPLPAVAKFANYSADAAAISPGLTPPRPNKLTPVLGRATTTRPFLTGETM